MLKMEQIATIKQMSQTETISTIAKVLGIDWKTARKYAEMEDFNVSIEEAMDRQRASKLDPYKEKIDAIMDEEERKRTPRKQRFTARRMHSHLVNDCGCRELESSYLLVQRYMRQSRQRRRRGYSEPGTMQLVWHPGEAQCDFGQAVFIVDGDEKTLHYFVMAFPNSNKRVMVVMPGENCECVCTALKEIFSFIGGVPQRIVFDNATGIGHRVQKTLEMNEGFTRFRLHYGFGTTFANPASGWEKGSVENAVGTLRRNLFVPVPIITGDLMEYNRGTILPKSFAYGSDEPHYRRGTPQGKLWEEDRKALLALPEKEFTVHRIDSVKTSSVGSVIIDSKFIYNLGPAHADERILVEKTAFMVVFLDIRGKVLKEFRRLYGDEPEEVFDIEQMLSGLVYKAGSWRNSHVREAMEDGILKQWLDSKADDRSGMRNALSVLSDATGKFGFADACHAAGKLLARGHFPSREDMESYCSRMRECSEGFSINTTGVELSVYDSLLAQEAN